MRHLRRLLVRVANTQAMTLVEILASIFSFMVILLATTSLISNGMVAIRMNGMEGIARAACIREMEQIKSLPWATIRDTMPIYVNGTPNTSTPFTAGLESLPNGVGKTYVQYYDLNGDGVANATDLARQITVSVSVYGNFNVLTELFDSFFETTAYASGGGGSGTPPNIGTLRSIWRLTTVITANGLNP